MKTKQLFKKRGYLLKKLNFYFVKDLSLTSLKMQKVNKNLRMFSWQWQTSITSFDGNPYWDTNKGRVQNVKIVLSKNHS